MWSHGTDSGYPSQDPVFVLNPHPLLSRVRNQSIIIKEFRGPRSVTGRVDPTRETRPFVVVVFRFGKDKTTVGESGWERKDEGQESKKRDIPKVFFYVWYILTPLKSVYVLTESTFLHSMWSVGNGSSFPNLNIRFDVTGRRGLFWGVKGKCSWRKSKGRESNTYMSYRLDPSRNRRGSRGVDGWTVRQRVFSRATTFRNFCSYFSGDSQDGFEGRRPDHGKETERTEGSLWTGGTPCVPVSHRSSLSILPQLRWDPDLGRLRGPETVYWLRSDSPS